MRLLYPILKIDFLKLAFSAVAAFSLGTACGAQEPRTSEAMDPSAIARHYELLRTAAVRGDNKAQFDAFIYAYEHASHLREHLPEALEFLVQSAAAGNVHAQYNFGFLLQTGTWIEKNEEDALPWLLLAAQKDHITAQLWAGINLANKYYKARDDDPQRQSYFSNAVHWLRKVNDTADPSSAEKEVAMVALGRIYFSQPDTRDQGISLIKAAADAGYAPAEKTLEDLADLIAEWNRIRQQSDSEAQGAQQ